MKLCKQKWNCIDICKECTYFWGKVRLFGLMVNQTLDGYFMPNPIYVYLYILWFVSE